MSSIGTGYDLAASTYSPDGRIFQVEYAVKTVESSAISIALSCNDGVLVAVDQPVPSKLNVKENGGQIFNVNEAIGLVGSGLNPEVGSLVDYAREEANKYLKRNMKPITVKKLASAVGERVHIFTLGISRPYGAALFLAAWDEEIGPSIYSIDPTGQCLKYFAWTIGKNAQAAKTEIEKIEHREELSKEELAKKAIHILLAVRDEGVTGQRMEMGWVGKDNGGKFERVDQQLIQTWEEQVQEEIQAAEQDD